MNTHDLFLGRSVIPAWVLLIISMNCAASWAAVRPGADLLVERHLGDLRGHHVGIVTNHTGRLSSGTFLVDTLLAAGINVVALFAPEHGIRGQEAAGEQISNGKDKRTGLPVYSLYGPHRKPTPEMLRSVDLLIYDIQDVGARFYTYISTMGLVMDAAAENGIPILVLDRPNPLGGRLIDGPIIDDSLRSFVGMYPIPVVYGMTCGELARMINGELWLASGLHAQLNVIPLEGWTRDMTWDQTGLAWVPPSPNIPDPATAMLYPATCFIEATNLSEGRGTSAPFRQFGAPFLSGSLLTKILNDQRLDGVSFTPAEFSPRSSKHAGKTCYGSSISLRDWEKFTPAKAGLTLLRVLKDTWPDNVTIRSASLKRLLGSALCASMLKQGDSIDKITLTWKDGVEQFRRLSQEYYLYP
jgi:uncharacterized protein YbbC (DUF1343 family)